MGVSNWNNIKPIIEAFFSNEFRSTKWFDYSQMSMLYVLYQIALQSHQPNAELLDTYTREASDWTVLGPRALATALLYLMGKLGLLVDSNHRYAINIGKILIEGLVGIAVGLAY